MSEVNDFLNQSASYENHESFKFSEVGATISGVVTGEPRVVESDDLDGGRSKKLVVDLETDDGTIYVVWLPAGKRITTAVADAVKASGAEGVAEGGTLKIKHTELGAVTRPGYSPPKLFKAHYTAPPAVTAVNLDEFE